MPAVVKAEITESPLRRTVKMEADMVTEMETPPVDGETPGDVTEANSLKRKAEGSPEVGKDVKKEKSE